MKKVVLLLFITVLPFSAIWAQNNFTEKDREMLFQMRTEIAEIKTEIKVRAEETDKRFESMQKQIDTRFEQIDKRFEQIDKRLDTIAQFMLGILATFTALCGIMFGLMIWDRRTMTKPFEEKIKKLDAQVEELSSNKETLKKVVQSLQQLAKNNTQLAEILKNANLL